MSEFQGSQKSKDAEMPDCCANCTFNAWGESGPMCRNPENYLREEDEERIYMDDYDGIVSWSDWCKHHNRGEPMPG